MGFEKEEWRMEENATANMDGSHLDTFWYSHSVLSELRCVKTMR